MIALAGLGNPGKKYEKTYHNMGFLFLDYFAKQHNLSLNQKKFDSIYFKTKINDQEVVLIKPQTFMNRSGQVIQQFLHFFKIPIENLIVITDDLDMEFGKIRWRDAGSSGGHNGIQSTIDHCGGKNFKRLKIGIGRSQTPKEAAEHVLSKMKKEELKQLSEIFKKAMERLFDFFKCSK